jgi:hypothetical protein
MRELYEGCCYGRHAEMDVIQKLFKNNKIKRQRNITLIVIRIDKDGNLRNSMPCSKCIDYMLTSNQRRLHRIVNIYYSNADGDVELTTLGKLKETHSGHLSKRFRDMN